jgi:hypothetical protein
MTNVLHTGAINPDVEATALVANQLNCARMNLD